MTDPYRALRVPVTPTDPDPAFAARLRARLERALALPTGVAMSITEISARTEPGAAIPYLAVRDARRALRWYADVFGARPRGEPVAMPDGRIGHAELDLAGGSLYLADEFADLGVVAPDPDRASVSLVLRVPDVDATAAAAVAADGRLVADVEEAYGYRRATVVDPFGHRWLLQTPVQTPAAREPSYRHGDTGYAWLSVGDVRRAEAFFGAVLGWTTTPGSVAEGSQVQGTTPSQGLHGGEEHPTLNCCYAVEDIQTAVRRVRAAGGAAGEPSSAPYGLVVDCRDDQGTAFALYQPPAGAEGAERPGQRGSRQGDLVYVTMEVADSARARAFYRAVLGWNFAPGGQPDGWQVPDTVPMTGMHGGHARATTLPMWQVDDLVAAVARARTAGGTATEPQQRPYGLEAECTDDQGTRFYLGQL